MFLPKGLQPFVLALSLAASSATFLRAAEAPLKTAASPSPALRRNLVIFVADGLRSRLVTDATAPEMARLRREGVDFQNSHSLYPTVTTPNAAAIATGRGLGDSGDFGNIIWAGAPTTADSPSFFSGLENDEALGSMNRRYGGDYLGAESLLASARLHGYATAAIGKLGPVAIQDVTNRGGDEDLVVDDSTGRDGGLPLGAAWKRAFQAAGVEAQAEDRGLNGDPGDYERSGVHVANVQQQNWFTAVATQVVLPHFAEAHRPFVLVFWSRDPDGTQHFNGDSLNALTPGINGPTSLAGVRNADDDLKALRAALRALHLEDDTDIVVTADHGFSTAAKASATSAAAARAYRDVPTGLLPRGFLAADLAAALKLPLFEGNRLPIDPAAGEHPRSDGQLIGSDPGHPEIAVASNGGSDLLYFLGPDPAATARAVVGALVKEDYVSALFADDALGPLPGALPLSAVGLKGAARTPTPSLVVSFRSFSTGCSDPELCAAEVADTDYQQGQGIHGSFSRADTHNFMAAYGPDFRTRFTDPAPVSNADWAPTLREILGLPAGPHAALGGRVVSESLRRDKDEPTPSFSARSVRSAPAANGFVTVLDEQDLGQERYYDAAGAPGRVVGLRP